MMLNNQMMQDHEIMQKIRPLIDDICIWGIRAVQPYKSTEMKEKCQQGIQASSQKIIEILTTARYPVVEAFVKAHINPKDALPEQGSELFDKPFFPGL